MLVVFVSTVVLATFLSYLVKIWIEDLLNYLRMDSAGSHEKMFKNKNGGDTSTDNRIDSSTSLSNIEIEISSDESSKDEEKIKKPLSLCNVVMNDTSIKSDTSIDLTGEDKEEKNNPSIFDISTDTDSIISDDFTQSSSMSYNAKKSMFSWANQEKNSKEKDQTISKSDTGTRKKKLRQPKPKRIKKNKNAMEDDSDLFFPPNVDIENVNKDIPEEVTIQHEITIAGTKVKLPVKPYPCQIAVMNKVIQGCAREQNCLLESPTGSGKTLALLCGVLAWQDSYSELIKKEMQKVVEDESFSDFNCHKERSGTMPDASPGCSTIDPMNSGAFEESKNCFSADMDDYEYISDDSSQDKRLKVPKIYYGTRTHKQLAQVVRELRRSNYRYKRMSVLSSREHSCIQQSTRNKTELCHDLLDSEKSWGCPYHNEKNKRALMSFSQLMSYGAPVPFDIEDLVELGKRQELCPYFAARNLAMEAEIVFCPYNYIIDPDIRESMQINLKHQVIILDEAHNVEDVCREIGSVAYREDNLLMVINECEILAKQLSGEEHIYLTITHYVQGLLKLIKSMSLESADNNDVLTSPCWTGKELLELLNIHNLGNTRYASVMGAAQAAIQDFIKNKEDIRAGVYAKQKSKKTISRNTKTILQHLLFGLNKIISKEYVDDYRSCINESFVKNVKKVADDTWISSQRQGQRLRTLKLMCMNPAVIFAPLARDARSIILASGTLTPTASFQSELGTKFPHVLSANHVIGHKQVYVACVPKGPSGVVLKANYQNVNSWNFQDELGKLVLTICRSVPHGVLCFFSSYYMMNTQISRWTNNNCWNEIQKYKRVFIEPRYSGDLAQIMTEYRETIEETSDRNSSYASPLSGAILFAVFRGKIAEGIDFSDNEARCVMSIGIPYPVRKDPEVNMKWEYNDKYSSKGLLKGSEWYTIQAFRALNQAIGRCIRHKNDWGAVLLVDERFLNQSNINNLPKWIRSRWTDNAVDNLVEELDNFVMTMTKNEQENKEAV